MITLHLGRELCSAGGKKIKAKTRLKKKQKSPENLGKYPEISKCLAWMYLKHELVLQNTSFVLERKLSRVWCKVLVKSPSEKWQLDFTNSLLKNISEISKPQNPNPFLLSTKIP